MRGSIPGKDDEQRDGSADPAPEGEPETGEDEKDAGVRKVAQRAIRATADDSLARLGSGSRATGPQASSSPLHGEAVNSACPSTTYRVAPTER